jgi:hypothetical protein
MDNNILNSPVPELSFTPSRPSASEGRHQRKCCVCRHPERDAPVVRSLRRFEPIEEAFLHWQSPKEEVCVQYDPAAVSARSALAVRSPVRCRAKRGPLRYNRISQPKLNANRKSGLLANVANH